MVIRVTDGRILVMWCVGLNASHYLANTRHIRLFGAGLQNFGVMPYLLRLSSGVEVLLIGTK